MDIMAKLEDLLDAHRTMFESLSKRMEDFENKLQSSSSGEAGKPTIEKLASDFNEFKSSVWAILELLKSLTLNLASQIDDVDNHTRRNALLFAGIKETEGEDLISTILNTIHTSMGLPDVTLNAIQHCHRLGTKSDDRPRPILVRFNDLQCRNLIWNNKKKLKSSSTVLSEFLTKPRQAIFAKARKHFGVSCCWTRNGAIFVKLPKNERRQVATTEDLDELMKKYPTPSNVSQPKKATPAGATDGVRLVPRRHLRKP